jgi:hypothetical protein
MITLDTNTQGVIKALQKVQTAHREAFKRALDGVAYDVRDEEVREMKRVFKNPTPYTLNSIKVKRTKDTGKLEARVWFRNTDSDFHYILPQVYGGDRRQKKFEYRLYKIGLLKKHEVLVPATKSSAIKLDRYGNVSRGQYVQILSQLQAFGDQGFRANETVDAANKRKRKVGGVRYFFARNTEEYEVTDGLPKGVKRQHLKSGIWARVRYVGGNMVFPVFFVADQANYEKRFDFWKVGKDTVRFRWNYQMKRAYILVRKKYWNKIMK